MPNDNKHNLKEAVLAECYEYSQADIAEKMFLSTNTVASIEKHAIEKFKEIFLEKGITIHDLL